MNIQWYPGHMSKALRELGESIRLVDFVCEIIDARIPVSSRNPALDEVIMKKPRLIVMNRADQADDRDTDDWISIYRSMGNAAIKTDCKSGKGIGAFKRAADGIMAERLERDRQKGRVRPIRVMVVGIPNVGKSSFINRLTGKAAAKTEDRPGVTRGRQWFTVRGGVELLDTPGVLWPKLEGENTGLYLAITGAVRDEIIDLETLAAVFLDKIKERYAENIALRYKTEIDRTKPGTDILVQLARRRGFLVSGGEVDTERMAKILLDEYRAGLLGRITLESPGSEGILA